MRKYVIIMLVVFVFSGQAFAQARQPNLNERIDENVFVRIGSDRDTDAWEPRGINGGLRFGNNWETLSVFTNKSGIINRIMYGKSCSSESEVVNLMGSLLQYFHELGYTIMRNGRFDDVPTISLMTIDGNNFVYLLSFRNGRNSGFILVQSSRRMNNFVE